jgi:hypothetical protein
MLKMSKKKKKKRGREKEKKREIAKKTIIALSTFG